MSYQWTHSTAPPSTMTPRPLCLLLAALLGPGLADPLAKEVIREMDEVISDHVEWDNFEAWTEIMAKYFTADMIYDTNWSPDGTMNNSTGIEEWWDHEHIPYNLAFDNATFNQVQSRNTSRRVGIIFLSSDDLRVRGDDCHHHHLRQLAVEGPLLHCGAQQRDDGRHHEDIRLLPHAGRQDLLQLDDHRHGGPDAAGGSQSPAQGKR